MNIDWGSAASVISDIRDAGVKGTSVDEHSQVTSFSMVLLLT